MERPWPARRADASAARDSISARRRAIVDGRVVEVRLDVLRMVHVAVPALAVVLPHELPVGADDVVPHRRHLRPLQPLRAEHRLEVAHGGVEGRGVVGEGHEDQPGHLPHVRGVQAELLPVEPVLGVHAAARHQRPIAGVGPLVVRAHEEPHVARRAGDETHPAVPARVVVRAEPSVVGADHDDGVRVERRTRGSPRAASPGRSGRRRASRGARYARGRARRWRARSRTRARG